MELNHYHQKLNIHVTSLIVKQLKTQGFRKWGNFRKVSRLNEGIASAVSLYQNQTFVHSAKKIKQN